MPNGRRCDVRAAQACALENASADAPRTIVMGLDQHRAQITAEWIDTATGEIGRADLRRRRYFHLTVRMEGVVLRIEDKNSM